jgi:hypothetical protein
MKDTRLEKRENWRMQSRTRCYDHSGRSRAVREFQAPARVQLALCIGSVAR